jgi:hypothetical protein
VLSNPEIRGQQPIRGECSARRPAESDPLWGVCDHACDHGQFAETIQFAEIIQSAYEIASTALSGPKTTRVRDEV